LRCWTRLKSRVGLMRASPLWAVISGPTPRPDAMRGPRTLNPTRWRISVINSLSELFLSSATIGTTCLLNMAASIIDSTVLCLLSFLSLSLSLALWDLSVVWIMDPLCGRLLFQRALYYRRCARATHGSNWSLEAEQLRSRLKKDTNRVRRRWFFSGSAIGRQRWGHLPSLEK